MVETNIIVKVHALGYSEFLQFIGICMFITAKLGTNQVKYTSNTHVDHFGRCSIHLNQIISGNHFESLCSALKLTDKTSPTFLDKS